MLLLNTWYRYPLWFCITLVLYPFVYLQVCYFLLTGHKNLNITNQYSSTLKNKNKRVANVWVDNTYNTVGAVLTFVQEKKNKQKTELKQKALTTSRNVSNLNSLSFYSKKTPKLTNQIKAALLFQPSEYQKPCNIKTGSC